MTAFRLPALEDLKAAADRLGLAASEDCLRSALAAMAPIEAAYRLLDETRRRAARYTCGQGRDQAAA